MTQLIKAVDETLVKRAGKDTSSIEVLSEREVASIANVCLTRCDQNSLCHDWNWKVQNEHKR